MSTGTAICPHCSAAMRQPVKASGELVTEQCELNRHRDETAGPVEVEVNGLVVTMPGGLRPIFIHDCPVAQQAVTLYADAEGGSVS